MQQEKTEQRRGRQVRIGRAPLIALALFLTACGEDNQTESNTGTSPSISFSRPAAQQLSQTGSVSVEFLLPAGMSAPGVTLTLDGVPVSAALTMTSDVATGTVATVGAGAHQLTASVEVAGQIVSTTVAFEAVALTHPDECELLNQADCLLPYPSSRFLEPADTPTGYRLSFPAVSLPVQNGKPLSPAPYAGLDGFSPAVQILMHFPGGVDTGASNAPRLLAATRTTDLRSLDADSPTVLLDWDTGERILHFIEPDATAAEQPAHQALFLRPGKSLTPGHRYIVAVRHLVHADGSAVQAEAPFAALRDDRPTDIAALASRRAHFEEVFTRLATAGVPRNDLVLAFDFVVQSDAGLTGQLLAMRDQAFAWLQEQTDAGTLTFTVGRVVHGDCSQPATRFWREVGGRFHVPLFLTADPVAQPGTRGTLAVSGDGTPMQNGVMQAPFTIAIPCAALNDGGTPLSPLVRGHGLFDTGRGAISVPTSYDALPELNLIAGATDWTGVATPDQLFFLSTVSNLNLFSATVDRLRQGILNTLVLARMMKTAVFNADAAFQFSSGVGVFAGPQAEMYYAGGSYGGIVGLTFAALSPDITNAYMDEGGINSVALTQRSDEWPLFATTLQASGITDPIQTALALNIVNELHTRADPAGYATHITSNPLPGTNAKHILMTMAWLDQSSPNLMTEIAARTLGLPSLEGSLRTNLPQIPDQPGPLPSALVIYDTGAVDLGNPAHTPFVPPLANLPPPISTNQCTPHALRISIPAAAEQLQAFLAPGGQIENFCNDVCDAGEPSELPSGIDPPCVPDPLE